MNAASALPATIDKAAAVARVDAHVSSWLVRLAAPARGTLASIELLHLPFWSYPFRASRRGTARSWTGHIAIEPRKRIAAVLPDGARPEAPPDGATLLPAADPPPAGEVQRVLFWEALARRRRDRPDAVTLDAPGLLYVPYWLGYLRGERWDLCPLDATTGKIDLAIKDSLIAALTDLDDRPPPPG